jgi:hypothetical protein
MSDNSYFKQLPTEINILYGSLFQFVNKIILTQKTDTDIN